jgi:phthalate 4,5-dioxygenase oxygenase subunit
MLTAEENDLLCRVEGAAPMGQIMRAHWIPALLPEQLKADGAPKRLRLLGEDLVAFRDTSGKIGVLGEQCMHRKASLVYGRNEDCGLRCLYHGWKFDVDGNVIDMPSEPAAERVMKNIKHKSYAVHEAAGFVWVYMGPAETMPAFEPPPWAPTPDTSISILRIEVNCNWAQILEGQIDSAHSSTLHSSDMVMVPEGISRAEANDTHWLRPSTDKSPRIIVQPTNYGMRYAAIRKPTLNSDSHDYVRITTYVAPFVALIPPNNLYNVATVLTPVDDTHTTFHFIAWNQTGGIDQDVWRRFGGAEIGVDVDENFHSYRTRANNYLQDREAMKNGDFTGVKGIPHQDIMMWEGMGPIADRTAESLSASDIAVIQFRRIMVKAARQYQDSGAVIGRGEPHIAQVKLASFEGIVPKATPWRTLGASEEEVASYAASAAKQSAAE